MIGLGWGLYVFVPPDPLWQLDNCVYAHPHLAKRFMLLTCDESNAYNRGPLVLRDFHTGQPLRSFFDEKVSYWVTLSHNGEWIIGSDAETGALRIAAVAGGPEKVIKLPEGESPSISWCDLSPDGTLLAAELHSHNNNDGDVYRHAIIDTHSGKELASWPGDGTARFTVDGRFLIVIAGDNAKQESRLKVWDARQRHWVIDFGTFAGISRSWNRSLGISPDGRTLIGAFANGEDESEAAAWDLETFKRTPLKLDHSFRWRQNAFSDVGRVAVLMSNREDWKFHVAVWDPDVRGWKQTASEEHGQQVLLSRDGKRLFVRSWCAPEMKTLAMYDVATGRRLWSISEPAHPFWQEPAPMFTPDDRVLMIYRGWKQPLYAAFLDVDTGKEVAAAPIAPADSWTDAQVTVSLDGSAHVVDVQRQSRWNGPWVDWLPAFLGLEEGFEERFVIDLETRSMRGRLRHRPDVTHYFDGGRRGITISASLHDGSWKPQSIVCWELPGHGPWRWVGGVPAALGGLIVAAAGVRRRLGVRVSGSEPAPA